MKGFLSLLFACITSFLLTVWIMHHIATRYLFSLEGQQIVGVVLSFGIMSALYLSIEYLRR